MQKNIAKQGYNSVKPQNWLTLGKILKCEAQSPIFSFHSHSHPRSGYSSQPLADFLPTCLAQAVELWE